MQQVRELPPVLVSIPSSSGRSLLTAAWFVDTHCPVMSQSPLHRGGLFNLAVLIATTMAAFSLNPLFIGEVSSTLRCRVLIQALLYVSIPSSSGRSLQLT